MKRVSLFRQIGWPWYLALFFALQAAGPAQAQAVEWKLDKNHTHVGFVARHLA